MIFRKVRRFSYLKAPYYQLLTKYVLKWRSPEVWRKTAGESKFWVFAGAPRCRGLRAKAHAYWGFFCPDEPAENILSRCDWRTETNRNPTLSGLWITLAAVRPSLRCAASLVIRGWCNYYRYAIAKRTFCALDDHVWRITYRWAKRRHPNKTRHWVVNRYFGVDRGDGLGSVRRPAPA